MKITSGFPPNYEEIKKVLNPDNRTVFTYGDTVYVGENGVSLTQDLFAHEGCHIKQQAKITPEAWWERYLKDPQFRLDQELNAYRLQYQAFKQHNNRNEAFFLALKLAKDLSSSMYGNIVSTSQAVKLIIQ